MSTRNPLFERLRCPPVFIDRFRSRTAWNAHANRRQYAAPADPWALVAIDPTEVDRFRTVSMLWGLGRVRDGDWDRPERCRSVRDLPVLTGFRQRFEEGREWPATAYYERAAERIDDGGSFKGCESRAELESDHLPALDDLYRDVRRNGYRTNRGVVYDDPADAETVHDLEPMVLLGRDGDVIWTEGYHRFAVARLLGLEAVPVFVLRRHAEWQATRDRLARGDVEHDADPSEHGVDAGHPDLQDLAADG